VQATDEYRLLFRQEYRSIVWSVNVVLHDYARSEEIAQDAFVRLLEHWGKVSRYDRPGAWVRRVAMRLAVKAAKRESRRGQVERSTLPPTEQPEPPMARDPALVAAVRELSPKQRAAVVLHYLEDRPVQEVSEMMGCSTATVNVHLHRARKRLSALLGEEAAAHVD
jgi:RNA polymerase sigma-70 factor (ECF subfamily)